MNEIINKISSYKIFNYIVPGIVYVVLVKEMTAINWVQEDIFLGLILYYFIGMTISRFGSIAIEPLLKKIKVVKFESYDKYYKASQRDSKVSDRLEDANAYRTFASLFLLLLITIILQEINTKFAINSNIQNYILIVLLLLMYICSYAKQIKLLVNRIIEANKDVN